MMLKHAKWAVWVTLVMTGVLVARRGAAGDLDPTNAPGPTMHTLEEIYQVVTSIQSVVTPAPVPKTGQTTSYGTGDDGDLQPGVTWPNPRFTVGSGVSSNCVTDELTGLMWLKNPDATTRDWSTALTYCNGLGGNGGRGGYTDWRLPTRFELESLVDCSQYDPALPSGHPFIGVQSSYYWSSTTYAYVTDLAWRVNADSGYVINANKTGSYYVWPVRGGE